MILTDLKWQGMIDFLEKYLSPKSLGLLLLSLCAIYIWFQHLRIKLLKDHLEFEKRKREDFVSDIEKARSAPPSRLLQPINKKQDRVLIVDDEPWLRDMISMTLKGHDPSLIVEEASDGEEAIRLFELNSPSILITDIMMPRLDGVKLLKELELLHKSVPTL